MTHKLPDNIKHVSSMGQNLWSEVDRNGTVWNFWAKSHDSYSAYNMITILVWKTATRNFASDQFPKRVFWGVVRKKEWWTTDGNPMARLFIVKELIRQGATLDYSVAKAYFPEDVTALNYDDREDPIWLRMIPRIGG